MSEQPEVNNPPIVSRETSPEKPPKRHKSTEGEVEERVSKILGMILDGIAYAEIVRYGAKEWQIKSRMIDKYIKKANDEIRRRAAIDREREIDFHVEARKRNLTRAVTSKDFRLVKDVLRDLAEMQGLYPKRQMEISTKNIPLTKEEIVTELAKFATNAGLTLEEYCHREGIVIEDIKGDIDEPPQ